jgi:ribonuclease P protein component
MKQGRRTRDELFTLYAVHNGLAHARLGVSVSRKTAARAVDRNRLRRQVRESFRYSQHALAGLDVVVLANAPARLAEHRALQESLTRHWQNIGSLCRPSSSA